jgi:hypothetical protein
MRRSFAGTKGSTRKSPEKSTKESTKTATSPQPPNLDRGPSIYQGQDYGIITVAWPRVFGFTLEKPEFKADFAI